jgi:hypothetical protein
MKAHIGCGKRNFGDDWLHFDGGNFNHLISNDILLESYRSNTFDLIYSSHLIAYFDAGEVLGLLKSWHAKLKRGGILRLATPDFSVLAKFHTIGLPIWKLLGPLYGKMHMGDNIIYHRCTYDFDSIKETLSSVGFHNVEKYDHTKTDHPNTGDRSDFYDDCSAAYINGTLISLNVEALKP